MAVTDLAADCETLSASVGDRVDGVATVAVQRPEARNALNPRLREELATVLGAVEAESDVRVLVLTGGEGTGAFVAGAEVTELRECDAMAMREPAKRPRVYELVDELPFPVIPGMNGHALGGGRELVQAYDLRIAHADALLGQPEIGLGIRPGGGATQRLPRLVGEGQAMELVLTRDPISANEAAEIGLVEEVHGDGDFDDRVYELAASMAANRPVALEHAKQTVGAAARMDLEAGIEYEAELFAALFGTADKNEGIDAFLEDREPEWRER